MKRESLRRKTPSLIALRPSSFRRASFIPIRWGGWCLRFSLPGVTLEARHSFHHRYQEWVWRGSLGKVKCYPQWVRAPFSGATVLVVHDPNLSVYLFGKGGCFSRRTSLRGNSCPKTCCGAPRGALAGALIMYVEITRLPLFPPTFLPRPFLDHALVFWRGLPPDAFPSVVLCDAFLR